MKTAIALSLLFGFVLTVNAKEIRHQVERSSDLERELAYSLSVKDKHDVGRFQGLEQIFPIKGPAPEYLVQFKVTTSGKLKELFGLSLKLADADGILVSVPLETQPKISEKLAQHKAAALGLQGDAAAVREVSVQFLIKKELITLAVLTIRCGSGASEENYAIRLADYASEPKNP